MWYKDWNGTEMGSKMWEVVAGLICWNELKKEEKICVESIPGQSWPYLIYWCIHWKGLQSFLSPLTKPITCLPMAVWLGQVGEGKSYGSRDRI